ARLMAVIVLPSAATGLETAMTDSSLDLRNGSIAVRRSLDVVAANEVGARRLPRCSSNSESRSASPALWFGSMAGGCGALKTDGGTWLGTVSGAADTAGGPCGAGGARGR